MTSIEAAKVTIEELKALAGRATARPWRVKEDSANGKDEVYSHFHCIGPIERADGCTRRPPRG